MPSRTFARLILTTALCAALPALAQPGLRLPERGGAGLDPAFARGWLAPDFDRFGFARRGWQEAPAFAPAQRMNWSYSLNGRSSLGVSMDARQFRYEPRHLSLFGHYSLDEDWAVSAETLSRDPSGLLRLQDFRIGVQRRF